MAVKERYQPYWGLSKKMNSPLGMAIMSWNLLAHRRDHEVKILADLNENEFVQQNAGTRICDGQQSHKE